jgi:hypothetical protein
MDRPEKLFVLTGFGMQIALCAFFALRKWWFASAVQWGWIVYALGIPAVAVSVFLLLENRPWYLWVSGFIFAAWATFGHIVDVASPVTWRNPINPPVFIPYVLLYLGSQMFYWWPMGALQRPLWFIYAGLFVLSTALNISSHAG